MNRNSNNHFANVPQIEIQRSRFEINHNYKTTFNTGDLIPVFWDEVLPGDTITMDVAAAIRMTTPIFPVMDNAYVDFYFFFVQNRLTWEHWREFLGENNTTAWEQTTEYAVPHIKSPKGGWAKGTIADYLGVPTKVEGLSVNALPFRAYTMIWNEFFRDQNLKQPAMVNTDDADVTGENQPTEVTDASYVTNAQLGGAPLKAAKYHDLFTSALPEPQKGPDVLIPLGGVSGEFPVIGNGMTLGLVGSNDGSGAVLHAGLSGNPTSSGTLFAIQRRYATAAGTDETKDTGEPGGNTASALLNNIGVTENPDYSGLVAQATGGAIGDNSTINQLRMAFAMQRFYERQARGGTRYREIIKNMFAVTTRDATMQIPEYLGGFREIINMDQVVQTSSTDATSPQGNTAAYSLTNIFNNGFTKSFDEHGIVMGLAVVRHDNTYQQGLNKKMLRRDKFDYYWPTLANIGEQPIYNAEIYAQGTDEDTEVFGYNEAWAEYRYHPNIVTGALRSNYAQTLDAWHYADYYTSLPTLSSQWIDASTASVDRTLAVQSSVEDQFITDILFKAYYTRPMPLYSVPGMIDHY